MSAVQAEPYAFAALEHVKLKPFLRWRACGMAVLFSQPSQDPRKPDFLSVEPD
jgi:hypothetical protein